MNFQGEGPTADIASVIKAPLPANPIAAVIRSDATKDCRRIFVLRAIVQLTKRAPHEITTPMPNSAKFDVPCGSAPSHGKAGIEWRLKLHGATKVSAPTANPAPEKYPRVATIAFGK